LVAQKSVLKRAISKPALAKRGMVSCLDYYLERHALKVSCTAVCRTARTVV
ncbi:group II intron reverse transcriptase/maturase, partial [Streptococcus agalactiae]|nr:group II intron reverse transcriptase/maturase [Streptococcus agalactiae]